MKISAVVATLMLATPLVSASAGASLRKRERQLNNEESIGEYHGGAAGDVGQWFETDFVNFFEQDIPNFFNSCFSGSTTVTTPHGVVTMADLQVGDKILAANGRYETVYAWAHKHTTQKAEFLQFNKRQLEITASHLVYVEGKSHPVRADSVKVGDVFQGATEPVKSIQKVTRKGVYTPLTKSGTVMVNGNIQASSYIALQDSEFVQMQNGLTVMSYQDLIHLALSPFRIFTMSTGSATTYTAEGIPTYVSASIDFAYWIQEQNMLVQALFLVAFLAIAGASMLVENTFGPTMAPVALAVVAAAYAMTRRTSQKVKSV